MSAAAHSHGDLTPFEISAYYRARMPNLDQRGNEWRAGCPIHDGKDPNFAVNAETGLWMCHSQCGRGGSIYDLEMALTGANFRKPRARYAASSAGRTRARPKGNRRRSGACLAGSTSICASGSRRWKLSMAGSTARPTHTSKPMAAFLTSRSVSSTSRTTRPSGSTPFHPTAAGSRGRRPASSRSCTA